MTMRRRRWLGVAAGAVAAGVLAPERAIAAEGLTFEVYQDAKKEFRWRLKSANGQVIATSGQGYKAKADCRHGIDLVRDGASKAQVEDLTARK